MTSFEAIAFQSLGRPSVCRNVFNFNASVRLGAQCGGLEAARTRKPLRRWAAGTYLIPLLFLSWEHSAAALRPRVLESRCGAGRGYLCTKLATLPPELAYQHGPFARALKRWWSSLRCEWDGTRTTHSVHNFEPVLVGKEPGSLRQNSLTPKP